MLIYSTQSLACYLRYYLHLARLFTIKSTIHRRLTLIFKSKEEKRFKRAYQRMQLGLSMKGQYRLLTLTTPENFYTDIHTTWRKWLMRMRRRDIVREYLVVKEWNQAHTCQHLHVLLRLSWIDYQIARQQWQQITGALWIHVDKVKKLRGITNYLCKYLSKAWQDNPNNRAYWYAYEWIYRKWRSFSNAMYILGNKVSLELHHTLHYLDPTSRPSILEYLASDARAKYERTLQGTKDYLLTYAITLNRLTKWGFGLGIATADLQTLA